MKSRKFPLFVSLLAFLITACLSLSAFAEEDLSIVDLNPDDVEEITLETPLVSNPLPIDFTGGSAPQESFYLDEYTYQDPTISVQITYKDVRQDYAPDPTFAKGKDMGVWIVDVRIGDASQLRTAAAKSFSKNSADSVLAIAGRVQSVVAINGDFATRRQEGLIIRQGETFRDKLKGVLDVLVVDEDGDFHVYFKPQKGEIADTVEGKKIVNAFYFGPVLVNNGEIPEQFTTFKYLEPDKYFSRVAICQIGPLHYKFILTTMQDNPSTTGLPLRAFAQVCKDEGAQIAYNLDGGNSASLIFRGELLNSVSKKEPRDVPDIVYFASSWNGGEAE